MPKFNSIYEAYSHPNKTLYNHVREIVMFANTLKGVGFSFNEDYLKILALFHDIGKLQKEWQDYIIGKGKRIKHSGPSSVLFFLSMHNKEVLSILRLEAIIKELKINLELSEEEIFALTYLILVHHSQLRLLRAGEGRNSYENFFSNFDTYAELLEKRGLLDKYEEAVATRIKVKNVDELLNSYAVFKIADRLSGSFHRNLREEEIPKIVYSLGITNFEEKLSQDSLHWLLSKIVKEVDRKRLEAQLQFLEGNVKMLLAPTGFGKTTFSIIKGLNSKRFLIVLPTITAIRQFLEKAKNIVTELGYFPNTIGTYFYLYNPFKGKLEEDDKLTLNEYFLSRYLLKPAIITTVDQLLLTYLQTKEYYIKRFALQKRLLIVDEIHLLSPKMLYFLLRFLQDYPNLFQNFVFMSATFPKFLRELIESELNLSDKEALLLYNYYPNNRIKIKLLNTDLEIKEDKKEEIFELIYNEIKKVREKKVLVIFNTVAKAQEFYEFLKEKGVENILLFHSRFIYIDRNKKEKKILQTNKPIILVATQVVEVSLDIDFDYLITELAPLPELIQRFGRVYRDPRKRELPPKEPNIAVFGYFENSKKVYEVELMKESYVVLKQFDNKVVDEKLLIQKLDESNFSNAYIKEFKEAKKDYGKLISEWLDEYSSRFYYLFTEGDEEATKKLNELVNIRDSINALVFVNESDLNEKDRRIYLKLQQLLEKGRKEKNYPLFFKARLYLREFLLSIPFYYLEKMGIDKESKGLPVLPSGFYNSETGFNLKKAKEYVGEEVYTLFI